METATVRIVASCPPNNSNTNQRTRAGIRFASKPTAADVTPEQAAMIEADAFLKVHRRLSRAWFMAHGIEFTEKNIEKYEKEDPVLPEELNAALRGPKAVEPAQAPKGKKTPQTPAGGQGGGEEVKPAIKPMSSAADIIAALEGLGKKAGEDFLPEAKRDDLYNIWKEASTKQS